MKYRAKSKGPRPFPLCRGDTAGLILFVSGNFRARKLLCPHIPPHAYTRAEWEFPCVSSQRMDNSVASSHVMGLGPFQSLLYKHGPAFHTAWGYSCGTGA